MRWKLKAMDYRSWHPWFAWFPVPTEQAQWAWLETVERQNQCSEAADAYCGPIWGYRLTSATGSGAA